MKRKKSLAASVGLLTMMLGADVSAAAAVANQDKLIAQGAYLARLDAMWEGSDRKPDWSKTGLAHSFSPKEHANGYA